MNYTEACAYLIEESRTKGMTLGLDTMQALMRELGNPQDSLRFIHIAGTNGKGSTASYLESILREAGYRTGKYTSPAVFDRREQYQVNGEWIGEEAFAAYTEAVKKAADRMGTLRPTSFEQETAIAFLWFAGQSCDIVVLETGLGGDMDATNIIKTGVCSVITSISPDHRRILGGTLGEIAKHKAGIIKPGIPAVVLKQGEEVMEVMRSRCLELGCRLAAADGIRLIRSDESGLTVSYQNGPLLHTRQCALWQMQNLETALETVTVLREAGYVIDEAAVSRGTERMEWHGRFEIIRTKGRPDLVLDGAHNPDGAAALRESLESRFPGQKRFFVMGVLADKDYPAMIRILLEGAAGVYTIESDSPRALPAKRLAEEIRSQLPGLAVSEMPDLSSALRKAMDAAIDAAMDAASDAGRSGMHSAAPCMKSAEKEAIVVVCGSLSFMKELSDIRKK